MRTVTATYWIRKVGPEGYPWLKLMSSAFITDHASLDKILSLIRVGMEHLGVEPRLVLEVHISDHEGGGETTIESPFHEPVEEGRRDSWI